MSDAQSASSADEMQLQQNICNLCHSISKILDLNIERSSNKIDGEKCKLTKCEIHQSNWFIHMIIDYQLLSTAELLVSLIVSNFKFSFQLFNWIGNAASMLLPRFIPWPQMIQPKPQLLPNNTQHNTANTEYPATNTQYTATNTPNVHPGPTCIKYTSTKHNTPRTHQYTNTQYSIMTNLTDTSHDPHPVMTLDRNECWLLFVSVRSSDSMGLSIGGVGKTWKLKSVRVF